MKKMLRGIQFECSPFAGTYSSYLTRCILCSRSDGGEGNSSSVGAIQCCKMSTLENERCTACRRDSPLVTDIEMRELTAGLPGWTIVQRGGIQQLERVFNVKDFAEALRFTNRVGALAEGEGHHPAILTEWGKVTVTLWTHKIHGLHRNDFIMAAKIDALAAGT
jgi:4a-hydroxytetrahydrobiopterin dehydratase